MGARKKSPGRPPPAPPPVPMTPAEELRLWWYVNLEMQFSAKRALRRASKDIRESLEGAERDMDRGFRPGSSTGLFGIATSEADFQCGQLEALALGQQALEAIAKAYGVPLVLTPHERHRLGLPPLPEVSADVSEAKP